MEPDTTDRREIEEEAVKIIERCWCSFRDQQMFQLLKYAVCAAEHSLTYEILRKLSPIEAELLRDPIFQPKVKFRFLGPDFPPFIVFKVYIQSDGKRVKYLSGKKIIKPASEYACAFEGGLIQSLVAKEVACERVDSIGLSRAVMAAVDACKQMGNRKYYHQMITDMCQSEADTITDEIDVTNLKEYMQYLKNTDEMPAKLGGKDNTWRKLSLEALPRHNIMYDVMTFLSSGFASPRLKSEMPEMAATRPITQTDQLQCIQAIPNKIRRPMLAEKTSGRRTKKAKDRVARMRRMYGLEDHATSEGRTAILLEDDTTSEGRTAILLEDDTTSMNPVDLPKIDVYDEFDDDNWEEEGEQLYQWSQELSTENLGQQTPNL
eukprot:gene11024-12188_t